MKDYLIYGLIVVGLIVMLALNAYLTIFYKFEPLPKDCTCYYRTTDDRFREGYTKANKPCLSIEGGHVMIGDTVYLNITEYRNECP